MDYKKLHEKTLAALQQMVSEGKITESIAKGICADFVKKSEDEKIRKEILQSIKDNMCVIHKDKCIAWLEKRAKQKPTWSEEDEQHLKEVIFNMHWAIKNCVDKEYAEKEIEKHIDWLKSLKERYSWKPSDEQIEALKEAADKHWEPDGLDPLYTLYQDLKKLKEE